MGVGGGGGKGEGGITEKVGVLTYNRDKRDSASFFNFFQEV